jgi:hypothetical protein
MVRRFVGGPKSDPRRVGSSAGWMRVPAPSPPPGSERDPSPHGARAQSFWPGLRLARLDLTVAQVVTR